jgi:transcriptional regulator with XRE-family HTH domain
MALTMTDRPRENRDWGRWVRRVRTEAGDTTQADAARRVGISQAYLSRWEQGDVPRAEMVEQFAAAYGQDPEEAKRIAGLEEPRSLEDRIADKLRGEGLLTPRQMVDVGLADRARRWGVSLPVDFFRAGAGVTDYEQAAAILADLDQQHAEGLI